MLLDNSQKPFGFLRLVDTALGERFNESLDGRQGGFNLMGYIGDKVFAHVLQTPQLGNIVDHHQGADLFLAGVHQRRAFQIQDFLAVLV